MFGELRPITIVVIKASVQASKVLYKYEFSSQIHCRKHFPHEDEFQSLPPNADFLILEMVLHPQQEGRRCTLDLGT
jgi:hypothetical protein